MSTFKNIMFVLFALVAVFVLSACGTTRDGRPCDGYVTTCLYEKVTAPESVVQPATQEVKKLFTDKVYDNKGNSIGTSCDAQDVSNYQSPNGSWTAVCNSTVAKCSNSGGSISVNDRGFAYCSATVSK